MSISKKTDSRADKSKRPQRVPLSQRKSLQAKQRPGYVRRYVNEVLGRVEMFKDAGWTIVEKDENLRDKNAQTESQISSVDRIVVNRDPNATCQHAVLMEIPEELHREDFEYNQAQIDETEQGLKPKSDAENYGEFKRK